MTSMKGNWQYVQLDKIFILMFLWCDHKKKKAIQSFKVIIETINLLLLHLTFFSFFHFHTQTIPLPLSLLLCLSLFLTLTHTFTFYFLSFCIMLNSKFIKSFRHAKILLQYYWLNHYNINNMHRHTHTKFFLFFPFLLLFCFAFSL